MLCIMRGRIKAALIESDMDKLGGIVEADETYIGRVRGRNARSRANILEIGGRGIAEGVS